MRICIIAVEIFAWGKYGGFGRASRMIGRELARRGHEVYAVVPRREDQRPLEDLDGIKVLAFKPANFGEAFRCYRQANADIYHSQEPSLGTYMAQLAMPDRKHIVTFRDTRDFEDWRTELRLPSLNPAQVAANWLYEDNWLVRRAVRRAHGWFAAAQLLVPKARRKYHLQSDPVFLPTPVAMPELGPKAETPTVCFVSRWDRRKRPEIFFELARAFPQVRFLAAGKSRDDAWDQQLRQQYGQLPNLEMLGFIDQFRSDALSRLLGQSWVMVNTAAREGLPNAFIEAAAHRCAILSAVDPDGFASRFGYHARSDDFAMGLQYLLENQRWQSLADQGHTYVQDVFSMQSAIDRHIEIYTNLLRG